MALHTLGTNGTTSLTAITFNPSAQVLAPADVASINQGMASESNFRAVNPRGIIATGSTHSNTTLDTLVAVAGAGLANIMIGDVVFGVGIPSGTFVAAILSPTSVRLSQAATATAAGVYIGFVRQDAEYETSLHPAGLLRISGRGVLRLAPGDIVATDNTGWPILLSAASLAYGGSLWTYT